ncbi:MAG: Holliday junction branch migration protein RuvA [Bacteroidaceae bacterium]|jgi:Holliday junction DNA helicase RuvA|nr:Holliday junction branch migration protein RuvA [Bacteroidaceae bacterium]
MIDYVRGAVAELTPTTATIECAGVGYLCNISVNTYSALQGKTEGKLYVYEAIREDAWVLFGFATQDERNLFLLLISVSGVGGNTARTMLSSFSVAELATVIMEGNERMLKTVKGLGTKTAQRVIVELKDKVSTLALGGGTSSLTANDDVATLNKEVYNEAVDAMRALGFPPAPVSKVVRAIMKEDPSLPVEKVIKQALKMM